jgi:hypothetical protein
MAMIAEGGASAGGERPFTVAENSVARAVIVLPDSPSPSAETGAAILGRWLSDMTGVRIPVKRESELSGPERPKTGAAETGPQDAFQSFIFVGDCAASRRLGCSAEGMIPGEFKILSEGNAVCVFGRDDSPSDPWGTRYGCACLLEKLGCRYLWPGESGRAFPVSSTLTIPHIDTSWRPALRWRQIRTMRYHENIASGLERLGMSKEDFERGRKGAGVNFDPLDINDWFCWHRLVKLGFKSGHAFGYAWDKYHPRHPEWFAMQPNGSREPIKNVPFSASRMQLCTSNEKLVETLAKDKIEELNRDASGEKSAASVKSVSVSPNDGGHTTYCTCPQCELMDPPEGKTVELMDFTVSPRRPFPHVSLTDRMVIFYNRLAERIREKHPDALVTADAYSAYTNPPVREKVARGLLLRFCGGSYLSENIRAQFLGDWDGWRDAGAEMYWRPNLLHVAAGQAIPLNYTRKLAVDFNLFLKRGMLATDFDSCIHHWSTHGFIYYALARLHAEQGIDIDTLLDDYCRAGFHKAWRDVRIYLKTLEALSDKIMEDPSGASFSKEAKEERMIREFNETMPVLTRCLDLAEKAVSDDKKALRRVGFLRAGLDFARLQAALYSLVYESKKKQLSPEGMSSASKLLALRIDKARDIMRSNPLAVNVAFCFFREGGAFNGIRGKRLPDSPPKTPVAADENGRVIE